MICPRAVLSSDTIRSTEASIVFFSWYGSWAAFCVQEGEQSGKKEGMWRVSFHPSDTAVDDAPATLWTDRHVAGVGGVVVLDWCISRGMKMGVTGRSQRVMGPVTKGVGSGSNKQRRHPSAWSAASAVCLGDRSSQHSSRPRSSGLTLGQRRQRVREPIPSASADERAGHGPRPFRTKDEL